MSSSSTDLMYTLREVPGKGKGLVATRMIPMGTRILSEEPIIRVPEAAPDTQALRASIHEQVDALTPHQRQAFLSMHNIHADDADSRHLGIIRTNALPFGDRVREAGIFLDACRINHACDNNAQKSWNENINRHTVHAKRDIENGEEITIFYLGVLNNRETRQEALRSKFAFTCSCRLCSVPPDQSQESDRRLDEILKLDGLIGRDGIMGIVSAPLRILRYVDQQIRLYNEQGPNDNGLPRAFIDAAQVAIANGDLARARIFAERAVLGWIVLGGDDSSQVLQHRAFSQDPSKHDLYGMSMKWKTAVDDVPQGLDSKEFEDWLWRREKPKQPEQPVDIDTGFDMVPRLSKGAVDRQNWQSFIKFIKAHYKNDELVDVKPNYIVFKAGEHLLLPFEGHKFLRFSSKISGSHAKGVEKYLDTVTRLAEVHFGSRIRRWIETADVRGVYDWQEVHESFKSYEQVCKILT
jgi:hypothetical protein